MVNTLRDSNFKMKAMFPIAFDKMNGTGNDFVVIDHRREVIPPDEQPEFARKVCRRMFSVGADGLILIEESDIADFRWRFYNSDGSIAEMCGNGSRCAARFAYNHGIAGKSMRFETVAGMIEAQVMEDGEVRILMIDPFDFREDLAVTLDGTERELFFLNTGVPHAVVFPEDDEVPVKIWGRMIRFHELFQPAGTNANFVTFRDDGSIKVRTYERGVEDETMACGTGAVASAIVAAMKKGVQSPVRVYTSGGDLLTIYFNLQQDTQSVKDVHMQGSTRLVYSGQLTPESLR